MKSLGIDLSTSATGLVLLQAQSCDHPKVLLEREINCKTKGVLRQKEIVTTIMQTIVDTAPDRIVVEGYSLNMRNASSVIPLVELGGLLRFMLWLDKLSWYDPRASVVKKFATGKGNAPKDVIMMNVLKRWGHESKTNNTADAYVCAAMGLAAFNRLHGITLEQRKLAGEMALISG